MKALFLLFLIFASTFAVYPQATNSVKLSGQIVCSSCWFEAPDRNKTPYGTLADIDCAKDCSQKGLGQSLAVRDEKGEFSLYALEKGDFKTKGKDFLDLVPKNVEIEGTVRTEKDKKFIKVNSLTILKNTESIEPASQDNNAALSLKDLSGIQQDIKSFQGRFVVLNFWATWCVPCKKEMPDLVKIQNDYAPLGLQVIGATADDDANKSKVLQFIKQAKINFPIWLGAKTTDTARFGVGTALPSTVIIDREGKVIWRKLGVIKPVELRAELDKLLAPKDSPQTAKKEQDVSLVPA